MYYVGTPLTWSYEDIGLAAELSQLRLRLAELLRPTRPAKCRSLSELALRERMKELACLRGVSNILNTASDSLDCFFQGVVTVLPNSWLYPEIACARVVFDGEQHATDNFTESSWVMGSDIVIAGKTAGTVEVRYLEAKPILDEGPFLTEERALIDTVAENLSVAVQRFQTHQRALVAEAALTERVKELSCLYNIATLQELHFHSSDRFLQGVADCLPESWQFPQHACARVRYGEKDYTTSGFRQTKWRISADVVANRKPVGTVEVFYRQSVCSANEDTFLKEEEALIKAVAERVGSVLMHMKSESDLLEAHRAIQKEHHALQEANVALRAVLSRLEEDKREIRSSIAANIQRIIMPVVFELELEVTGRHRSYVTLLRQTLQEIASPFLTEMARHHLELTPVELAVSTMIRNGLSTKEIAKLRCISPATVRRHRENIRRKLGLRSRKINLATYLQASGTDSSTLDIDSVTSSRPILEQGK